MSNVEFICANRNCRDKHDKPGYCKVCSKMRNDAFKRGHEAHRARPLNQEQSDKLIDDIIEALS